MEFIDWKTGLGIKLDNKNLSKSLGKSVVLTPDWSKNNRLSKAQPRGEPAGTIHTWKDGKKYRKEQDGTWKEVTDGKQSAGTKNEAKNDSNISANQLREALKQYHIKKDEFNGGFLLKIGPKSGVDGENYIGEDGKPGEYNDSKTFESKEEVKQFIKDKIIPAIEKEHAEKIGSSPKKSDDTKDVADNKRQNTKENDANSLLSPKEKKYTEKMVADDVETMMEDGLDEYLEDKDRGSVKNILKRPPFSTLARINPKKFRNYTGEISEGMSIPDGPLSADDKRYMKELIKEDITGILDEIEEHGGVDKVRNLEPFTMLSKLDPKLHSKVVSQFDSESSNNKQEESKEKGVPFSKLKLGSLVNVIRPPRLKSDGMTPKDSIGTGEIVAIDYSLGEFEIKLKSGVHIYMDSTELDKIKLR